MLVGAYALVRIYLHFVGVSLIYGILATRSATGTTLLAQSTRFTLCLDVKRKLTFLTGVNANTTGFTESAIITRNVSTYGTIACGTS